MLSEKQMVSTQKHNEIHHRPHVDYTTDEFFHVLITEEGIYGSLT